MKKALVIGLFTALFVLPGMLRAADKEICIYQDSAGNLVQVNGRAKVPEDQRSAATCFGEKTNTGYLAKPDDIELKGNLRIEEMSSPLGPVRLRWPRKVESLFGRTPERALLEAMRAVARALKNSSFPSEVKNMQRNFEVVFMDENLPETQIPLALISNCHPAWMTPPANLYIVAQRVVEGCGAKRRSSSQVADSELAQVLMHEIGHVVEYSLLEPIGKTMPNRARAEGFATWFEYYAAGFSSMVNKNAIWAEHQQWARQSFMEQPRFAAFHGTANDYARAALLFHYLVKKRGPSGVADLYAAMNKDKTDIGAVLERRWDLNAEKIERETANLLTAPKS